VVYLIEKNRLPPSVYDELTNALADPEHVLTERPLSPWPSVQAMRQVRRAEVPDMPDRIVAGTAVYLDVPAISRDSRIRAGQPENGLVRDAFIERIETIMSYPQITPTADGPAIVHSSDFSLVTVNKPATAGEI
jgi:hypothetical protein